MLVSPNRQLLWGETVPWCGQFVAGGGGSFLHKFDVSERKRMAHILAYWFDALECRLKVGPSSPILRSPSGVTTARPGTSKPSAPGLLPGATRTSWAGVYFEPNRRFRGGAEVTLDGAGSAAVAQGLGLLPGVSHYALSHDPSGWTYDVPHSPPAYFSVQAASAHSAPSLYQA